MLKITFVTSINHIDKDTWQSLNNSPSPFTHYDYFHALENSQSAVKSRGWQPYHALFYDNNIVVAIMPLYIKYHSWGEYVFDHAWVDAYEHYKIPYYPKLVASVPFTPVTTDKLISCGLTLTDVLPSLLNRLIKTPPPLSQHLAMLTSISGLHLLFIQQINTREVSPVDHHKASTELTNNEMHHRHTVQFHWFNNHYQSFDDYLTTFTARKRKNTKKERASILQQGIEVERIKGEQLTKAELDYFYYAYQSTYAKKGHHPHLTYEFFEQVFNTLAQNIMLVVAKKHTSLGVVEEKNRVACALFFYDDTHLYGRYWGCSEHINNLHFELCYYQGIEFCIELGLQVFNPGTQGEHKIQRGFTPVLTHSYHWLKQAEFNTAIAEYCQQERSQLIDYQAQCQQALPFKQDN